MIPEGALTVGDLRVLIAAMADDDHVMVSVDGVNAAWAVLAVRDDGSRTLDVCGGQVSPELAAIAAHQLDVARKRAQLAAKPVIASGADRLRIATPDDGQCYVDYEGRSTYHAVQVLSGPGAGRRGRITQPVVHADGWVGVALDGDPTGSPMPFDPARLGWVSS